MTDRDFWMLIRRALLMICKAIECKYLVLPPSEPCADLTIDND